MLFNSYLFIFLFLPLVLLGWYGCNRIQQYTLAKLFLLGMSLWFYGYFHGGYLLLILISCLVNHIISRYVQESRPLMLLGVVFNLGMLGYYKYYDFLLGSINAWTGSEFTLRHILLPLGISFFTFQQLSYVLDRYHGKAPHYPLLDYMTFVTFFPQLIAGPIVLHHELVPALKEAAKKPLDQKLFAQGIVYFVLGLSKKVLLADTLAKPANFAFAQYDSLDSLSLVVGVMAYMFELYFDFSGYCDMAVGIGKMFGITLPTNFDSPYQSTSVKELWRRWHITLGRFFTTYVYIPLGGSKGGRGKQIRNTLAVFTLSGLWHGANWTFVLWGILQGLGVVWDQVKPKALVPSTKRGKICGCVATNLFFALSLILFRSDSLEAAWGYLKGIFSFRYFNSIGALAGQLELSELYVLEKVLSLKAPELIHALNLLVLFVLLVLSFVILGQKNSAYLAQQREKTKGFALWLALLFTWSVLSLSGVSTFLYFNF